MDFKRIKQCRVCDSVRLRSYLKLGKQPLANALQLHPYESIEIYPLEVLFCLDCSLSQLSIVVDPEILYTDYPYHSSVSDTFKLHCIDMALHLKQFSKMKHPSLIDVACNDGILIEKFQRKGFGLMWGVEPSAQQANRCNNNKLTVINKFWKKKEVECLPRVDFITALNVFAHVDDIRDFIVTSIEHLKQEGVLVIEVPYLWNLLSENQFDTIYHEHLSYFLLRPLKILFKNMRCPIFRVEEYPIHGGSIRIYASPHNFPEHPSVKRMEDFEYGKGLYKFQTYLKFAKKLRALKDKFTSLLTDFRQRGKKVAGFGASAKGISLMNYCGITYQDISYIVDDTKSKQGKFTPGGSIPIVSRDNFDTNAPDYIALLAWNFSDELIQKTASYKQKGGQYIVPIPEVKIL